RSIQFKRAELSPEIGDWKHQGDAPSYGLSPKRQIAQGGVDGRRQAVQIVLTHQAQFFDDRAAQIDRALWRYGRAEAHGCVDCSGAHSRKKTIVHVYRDIIADMGSPFEAQEPSAKTTCAG